MEGDRVWVQSVHSLKSVFMTFTMRTRWMLDGAMVFASCYDAAVVRAGMLPFARSTRHSPKLFTIQSEVPIHTELIPIYLS